MQLLYLTSTQTVGVWGVGVERDLLLTTTGGWWVVGGAGLAFNYTSGGGGGEGGIPLTRTPRRLAVNYNSWRTCC